MDSEYLNLHKKRHWQAFFIAFAMAAILFIPTLLTGEGLFTYYGDYNVQQIPFYQLAHRAVRSGSFMWNWETDLGANFIASYSFYLLFSPFFWLTLPFPTAWLPYLMAPLFVLKFAFAAFFAYFYIKRFVEDTTFAVIGGLLYSFSGFMVYNIFFNHFHDVVVFFPLLLIGLEKMIKENKRGFFAVAVFINAIVNYWFFIGEVVFVILYFCIRCTDKALVPNVKTWFAKFGLAWLEAIIGVLMALSVLLPSCLALLGNPRTGSDSLLTGWNLIYHSSPQRYLHIIASFFFPPDLPSRPNFFPDHGAKWASLAAWLPFVSMCGVIAYLQCTRNNWLRKMIAACAVFALCRGLNSAFILLNSSYYARWFYMFTLMTSLATVIALERSSRDINIERGTKWTATITIVISAVVGLTPKTEKSGGEDVLSIGLMDSPAEFWSWVLIALGSLLLFAVLFKKFKGTARFAKVMLAGVALVGVIYSTVLVNVGRAVSSTIDDVLDVALPGQKVITLPEEEGSFARSDYYEMMENTGMFWSTPTIRCFHSIVPVSVMEFYPTVGVERDVSSKPDHSIYPLRAFLSTKWLFIEEETSDQSPMPGFSLYDTQMGINIYINENYIPMGFTYDNYISQDEYDSLTKNERAYALLNYIVLNEEQIEKHKDILDYSSCYVSTFYDDFENSVWERTLGSAYYFDYDNTGFTSKIELEEENLVFFSVPYEKGWSAYVNGEKAEIEKVNVGFMAVRVPAGDNEIRFEYFTPGLKIGLVGTAVGTLALIAYVALHILSLRKQRLSIAIEDDKQLRATLDSPDIIPAGYEDDEDELFGETLRHLRSSTVSDSDTIYPADDPSKPKEGGFAVVDALPDTSEEFISVDDLDLDALDDDYSEYSELMLPEAEEDAEQVSNEYTHKWINDDKNKE
ncbi:MAG: YfhO family protein [Oscillospiraceae bacterium]|nr:YfhO family protein [Oscillospiraceae bacterium]